MPSLVQDFVARQLISGEVARLICTDGRVASLEPKPSVAPDGWWLAPGLFDVQVNGFGGVDFQTEAIEAASLVKAVRALRQAGCLRFLLTLITDDWPVLIARLKRLRELRNSSVELRSAIAGWHLEGPFLSEEPGYHGAHDPKLMRDPSPTLMRELRGAAGDLPLLVTLAPERAGSIEAISAARACGITVSLGHSNASATVIKGAMRAGATGFTHLGNACPQALDRHDNIVWRVLDTRGLQVGLIPDGRHVSPALFRLVHRVLSGDSILYTTDAMAAAAAPPGCYRLGRMELKVGADRVVRQPGKTNFAGSALTPIEAVFRAASMLEAPWQDCWRRMSEIPARWLGLPNGLTVGESADFCLVRPQFADGRIELRVFVAGQQVAECLVDHCGMQGTQPA